MKRLLIVVLLIVLAQINAIAGDGEYAASKISLSLRMKANAVIRLHDSYFEILNTKQTLFKEHYVITILNEKGDDLADFSEHYNKHRHVQSVEGYLYDAYGKQIKKIKKKDTQDVSGVADGTLMDDSRYRSHNFYYRVYPYTIEYFVEIENSASLFFPSWIPQPMEGVSVEQSSFSIQYPIDYKLRFKAFNYKGDPSAVNEKNDKILKWESSNMPAVWKELYSPMWHELTTMVIFGPGDFQMEGYKGNMLTWQDFGKFVYSLKQGMDVLPGTVKSIVHEISDPIADPKEKIAKLYEYMQKNTRYVSIQLGIGGWQPFDAKEVASKGYGDCKALTNYMYTILKEAGIASYYTLVRAGKNSKYITDDFPSQQFNHVILCVPLKKDTVWLECTSQTMQAGYLGDFTSDRLALLIDENGGKIIRTPSYSMNENLQVRNIKAVLGDNGTLRLDVLSRYSGLQQDDIHGRIKSLSKDKLKEQLHEQLDFATYDISKFAYQEEKTSVPRISESLEITVSNYATITGKRIFIIPNIMTRSGLKLTRDSARKSDIQMGFEYKDLDSVEIDLPHGYIVEALPKDVSMKSKFGNYSTSVKLVGDKLYYYRLIEHYSGRYPATDYEELVKFYETIYVSDRKKLVLVKN